MSTLQWRANEDLTSIIFPSWTKLREETTKRMVNTFKRKLYNNYKLQLENAFDTKSPQTLSPSPSNRGSFSSCYLVNKKRREHNLSFPTCWTWAGFSHQSTSNFYHHLVLPLPLQGSDIWIPPTYGWYKTPTSCRRSASEATNNFFSCCWNLQLHLATTRGLMIIQAAVNPHLLTDYPRPRVRFLWPDMEQFPSLQPNFFFPHIFVRWMHWPERGDKLALDGQDEALTATT